MLDLVDVLHTDEQHGGRFGSVRTIQCHGCGRRVHSVGHTFDAGDLVRHSLGQVFAGGDDVDAVAGGERVVHGLFDAGRSGGDGGDQGHADEQGRACSCDASRILLYVAVRDFRGRPGKRHQRSGAFHQCGQPEDGGEHHAEEYERGAGNGDQHRHCEFVGLSRLSAVGGLNAPD